MAEWLQFVTFFVDKRLYGLDIRIVKEINPTVNITPVPRTERQIRGLVNMRGQVVLVIDIATIFGRGPQTVTDESHIVILKVASEIESLRDVGVDLVSDPFGDKPLGFLVDTVGDVVGVPAGEVKPVPPHVDEANAAYFDGVVQLPDGLLILLDASEMLSRSRPGSTN